MTNLNARIIITNWKDLDKWANPKRSLSNFKMPEGWSVIPVKKLVKQFSLREKVQTDKEYRMIGVKWYGEGTFHRETVLGKGLSAKWLTPVVPNAFIYNRLFAWKESFAVVPNEHNGHYVSNEFPQFIVDETLILPYYLYMIFIQDKVIKVVEGSSIGSAAVSRNRFKEEDFLSFEIPVPPLPIQQKIVLYWKNAQKKAEELRKRAEEKEREIVKYIYIELGIENKENINKKGPFVIEFKELEGRWDAVFYAKELTTKRSAFYKWVKLKNYCIFSQYGYTGSATAKNTGVRFLRITDIDYFGDYDINKLPYVQIDQNYLNKYLLDEGDFLVARTGATAGKCSIAGKSNEKVVFASYLIRFKFSKEIFIPFLEQYLNMGPGKKIVFEIAYSSGRPNINANEIQQIQIPLPPLEKQREISERVGLIRDEINYLRLNATQLIENTKIELGAIIWGKKSIEEV